MFEIKTGSSFGARLTWYQSLVGCTVSSQVRDLSDNLIATLVPTVVDAANGVLDLSTPLKTWPAGKLNWDVRVTNAEGFVVYTETIPIQVAKVVTR